MRIFTHPKWQLVEFARKMVAQGQFGVNRICQLTGISKATYYAARNPMVKFETKYAHFQNIIAQIIEANPAYGINRIQAELKATYKLDIGRDTLAKLLKLWGLNLKRKLKPTKPSMIQKILLALASRANLLIRTRLTAPFQAISSDITELKFKGGKAYLCVHKDVFGQMVYGCPTPTRGHQPTISVKNHSLADLKMNGGMRSLK